MEDFLVKFLIFSHFPLISSASENPVIGRRSGVVLYLDPFRCRDGLFHRDREFTLHGCRLRGQPTLHGGWTVLLSRHEDRAAIKISQDALKYSESRPSAAKRLKYRSCGCSFKYIITRTVYYHHLHNYRPQTKFGSR